jgi:serine phosphatase RsbU (regulator of sigma subunit)/ligand-binding sensor domain-containing protein
MNRTRSLQLLDWKLLFTSVIFFFSTYIHAQVINTQSLTVTDGLVSNTILDVFQDSYGLIWIGTYEGLHVYDGYKIEKIKNVPGNTSSIQDNTIRRIIEDKDKNIWIGNDLGVSMYSRKTNKFTNYYLDEVLGDGTYNSFSCLFILFDSKNRMWITTDNRGIVLYDPSENIWKYADYLLNDTRTPMTTEFVLGIAEDSNGTMWIGALDHGLMSYDSKDSIFVPVIISKNNSGIEFKSLEDHITYLYSDINNVMWITSRNGIYKFNPEQGELKTIVEYNSLKLEFHNLWNKIFEDNLGNIWISNNFRGILKFDGISDEYEEISFAGYDRSRDGRSGVETTFSIVDKSGIIWFGSQSYGLLKYDPSNEPFTLFSKDETNKTSISNNQISSILESKIHKGKIYIGTGDGGLNIFDQKKQTFNKINFNSANSLLSGSINSIFEEDDGSLWLGTNNEGLVKLNTQYQLENQYKNDSLAFNSLSNNSVQVIKKDGKGNLWIGTRQGLNHLNLRTKKLKRIGSLGLTFYPHELVEITSNMLKSNEKNVRIGKVSNDQNITKEFEVIKPREYLVVSSEEGFVNNTILYDYGWILNSQNDTIWGSSDNRRTFHAGGDTKNRLTIDILFLKPGKYKLRYKSDDSHSYNNWNATPPIYPELWGIHVVELENESKRATIKDYLDKSKNQILIRGDDIRSIHISDKNVWIGTLNGLNKVEPERNTVKIYSPDENTENSNINDRVQYIHEDKNGIFWLGTSKGLNRFDPVKEEYKIYTEKDGLPTNLISSILQGNGSELWISTANGISKMVSDKETDQVTFVNYDSDDLLGGMDFTAGAALKSSNGEYYFGGKHGLNSFNPNKSNNVEPDLIFSDLKISNNSVRTFSEDETPLETSLIELEELELPYDQNDLTFEFAAIHYSAPNKNQYAHKLIGYDEDWIYNNKREVTYTNLNPGEYEFSIKGSNRDGVWSTSPKSIRINITPPWWFSTWAYVGYGLLFLGIIFGIDRFQRRRLLAKAKERMKIQNAEHRAETAELQAQAAESQAKVIQIENERKTKELEEARELQLSMLPKNLPDLPNLDIAVYMKTATEVGGDYYDFHVGIDGTLTVVIGDATGHGMKAGTVVTAAKSLFNSYGSHTDILYSFQEISRCIKQLHLQNLSMCLSMLKIKNNQLIMSSAGMPPIYLYRKETNAVEEYQIEGMPLGAINNFPYKQKEKTLEQGDIILLMSDGFPELMNNNKEMYGYKRARNLFEEASDKSPEEIIKNLKDSGSDWVNDNDPDDDVTFVVIKVK